MGECIPNDETPHTWSKKFLVESLILKLEEETLVLEV